MNENRRQRGGRKTFQRREEILDVAAEIFYRKGYDATSTKDIADAAGLLKGSLYYYVDSKEDFLYEIIKASHQGAQRLLDRVRQYDGDALERLAYLIVEHLTYHTSNLVSTTLYFREFRVLSPERRQEIQADGDRYLDFVSELLTEGQQQGLVAADVDRRVVAIGLVGMLNSAWLWYRPDGSRSTAELAGEFARIILAGVASESAVKRHRGLDGFRGHVVTELAASRALDGAANGKAAAGKAAKVVSPKGTSPNGKAATGKASNGKASNGKASNGKAANGKASTGKASTGKAAKSTSADGTASNGRQPAASKRSRTAAP